jgi:hypothetical protein
MGCTPSVDVLCRPRPDVIGLLAQLREAHTVSSVTGVIAAVASMLLLGGLLGASPRWRSLGKIGQVAAVAVIALGLLELPLTLTSHWVGLVERASVLCISWWFAALAVVALRTAVRGRARPEASPTS